MATGGVMSIISADFALAEHRPMTYWWPLLCEAMWCQGLGYENPHWLPAQAGDYQFHYAVDKERFSYGVDLEVKNAQSFRQLCDDLHDERCRGVHVGFWSVLPPDLGPEVESEPELVLEGALYQNPETQAVTLSCWLPYLGRGLTP